MSSKLIRFLLSLLLFHYAVSDSLESNIDEFDDGEKLSVDDKFDSLEANIIQKLESLGRLEDLISRESKVSADSKTKLAAIEKELPDLVDKIKRTLDIVEKIPESFDRVNNRLNVLEKSTGPDTLSPRANRSTSPNSDEDVNYLENLVTKLEKDFIARNKLYNENLFKTETPELDELDSTLINITGKTFQDNKLERLRMS